MTTTRPRESMADPLLQRWSARFRDPDLERSFQEDYVRGRLQPFVQRSLGLGVLVFVSYLVVDCLLIADFRRALVLRLGIGLPLMLGAWGLSFTRLFERVSQQSLLAYGVGASAATLSISAIAEPNAAITYGVFPSIFVTIGPLLARLAVRTEVLYTALSTLLTVALLFGRADLSPVLKGVVLWTLLSMGALGALLAWLNERQERDAFLAARMIDSQTREIERERARSEDLLRNVLPSEIADRLKDGAQVIADAHPAVTVLFADIVGFTKLSSELSPAAIVERLNEIFTAFDAHCESLGLEKIKTIGDSYMVVGGAPTARADHAVAVVRMGIAMRETLAAMRGRGGDDLEVRIGAHSGPLVAGVIGKRKFAYDVWGDTVNVASRMESHSIPGELQITEATAKLVEDHFALEARGTIEVKGKGPMRTWLVRGPRTRAG
jgi:class 3 adenylate cyclase